MKVFQCRAAGYNCDFEARGETEEEVLKVATEHLNTMHDWDIPKIPPAKAEKIQKLIEVERVRRQTKTSLTIDGTKALEIHKKEKKD